MQPFPVRQQDKVFAYIQSTQDFIFVDAMRNKYDKLKFQELQACLMPNKLTYVCQETFPLYTFKPNDDCESTLLHPSTLILSKQLCEHRILTLESTYWIPLHLSNEWL
jgi:hypothetical protein